MPFEASCLYGSRAKAIPESKHDGVRHSDQWDARQTLAEPTFRAGRANDQRELYRPHRH